MQVGKQIKVYEDGYKGPKVLTQAQQNKLLAIRPQPKPINNRLMYMDDDNNTDEQDDDADDEEETIPKVKPKIFYIYYSSSLHPATGQFPNSPPIQLGQQSIRSSSPGQQPIRFLHGSQQMLRNTQISYPSRPYIQLNAKQSYRSPQNQIPARSYMARKPASNIPGQQSTGSSSAALLPKSQQLSGDNNLLQIQIIITFFTKFQIVPIKQPSKLILVLALAVISFARPFATRHRPFAKDFTPDKTSLFYFAEKMDDNLIVTIDIANEQDGFVYTGKVKINTLKQLHITPRSDASSFQLFTDEKVAQLNAFQKIYPDEQACGLVYDYYTRSLYTFFGFAAYSYKSIDIAPSITGLVANSPNYITYTDTSIPYEDQIQYKSCSGQPAPGGGVYFYDEYYTSFAIDKYGIVGYECMPNTFAPQGPITSCTSGFLGVTNNATLKGYRIGVALDQSVSDIKGLILRFGPVLVDFVDDYLIIIGWKKDQGVDNFIVLALDDNDRFFITTDATSHYSLSDVLVIFNLDEKCTDGGTCSTEQDCAQPTSQTPISQCPCLTTSDPRDECKTSPAVDCTKTPDDAACEGDCKDNTKKTITECACIVGDKRDECKEAGKDASGSTRAALSVITAAVVLPLFALFL
ncbi:MAG: hypothetical protein EZS28_008269 [Streblomastix strix]|uniref:Uncharacterized protein n=1 Tax=Streblomastix strix TaxID=222440 RepID=A0A5J4WN25_9EUKA|nr:MAG: hypothetical protein EZS28_008269 [Streblomastix strix]